MTTNDAVNAVSASSAASPLSDPSSVSSFLLTGLSGLYELSSRRHEVLRASCVAVLAQIKAADKLSKEKALKG